MDLTLKRLELRPDGIFSNLKDDNNVVIAVTLEHAYAASPNGSEYLPKIPPGTHICVRGQHRLHNMTQDFTTFEITGIPRHTNLLFHWGNYNNDSEGCVLLGKTTLLLSDGSQMITASKAAFSDFMDLQKGVDKFILTVE